MRNNDIILGVVMNGAARAYPWWIMDNHHLANDLVGDTPVVVLLCEICSTGIALSPIVDGRRLTFGVRHTYNGTIAFEDHQSRSLWSPYLAMAIRGRLEGTRLSVHPLQQMEWKVWKERHPETTVLPGDLGTRTGHGSEDSIESGRLPSGFRASLARWDDRLPHHTLVLGVIGRRGVRAYPLSMLKETEGVLNDDLGGDPIVILSDIRLGSYAALAFSRVINGRTLSFLPDREGILDEQTRSLWTAEGTGRSGPLAGVQLEFVSSHVSQWYVWAAHFPNLEIAS